ncbi:MAG TPA: efflux RND transporter periplasmic adaptor subunit [Bryobacteraceae bacterium]|nr:efflux RND transporter periplasmic adaptor subunit [Bryobacteraceae bacterium]
MKKVIIRVGVLAVLAAAGWGGYWFLQQLPERQEKVPTAKVMRGDVVIRAYSRGELRAVRSVTLTAPNLFGTVQVTRLAPMGALAKEKDLIVEFDDSERRASLEEAQLAVEQIDEQIKKAKADMAIQQSQDRVNLVKTQYAVRSAELDVQQNEIISAIDAKKNLLTLEQQKRALQQLQSDIKSRQEQADAQIGALQEQRNKSLIDVQREQMRIAQTKMLAPIAGLVAIKQNRSGYFNFGQQLPDIREGDTLQPGMPVADLLDLSELEVVAKVGEMDRANLHEGQDAILQLDAVPDKQFRGKIKSMSGTASSDVFSGDPAKKFDVVFSIDMRQLLTSLGLKPEMVDRIMATAQANARKAPPGGYQPAVLGGGMQAAPGMAGGMPGGPGASGPGAGGPQAGGFGPPDQQGFAGGQGQAGFGGQNQRGQRGGRGARNGGGRGFGGGRNSNLSDEDRQKFRQMMQQAMSGKDPGKISPEDRQKIVQQIQEALKKQGGSGQAAQGGSGNAGPGADSALGLIRRPRSFAQFTDEERANAKLPVPPEEDSQLQVLLRPGLLADVEIIVEKVPDALHVPVQAIFQKNGKPTVFVENGTKFEPREVQLVKQSESTMVLASGVKPGEVVALSDPTVDKSQSSKKGSSEKQGSPMGIVGGGK